MQPDPVDPATTARHVSPLRRAAAAFYDALALGAIWFVVAGIAVGLHHGEAISPQEHRFRWLLLLAAWAYFAGCWHRGGQTLGMKTWRIRVVDRATGAPPSWRRASLRFAIGGLHWLLLAIGAWGCWFLWSSRGLFLGAIGAGTTLGFAYWCALGGRGEALIDRSAGSRLEFRN